MKLLVHNFLTSKFLKGVSSGFPLKVVATQVETKEQEFNPDFIRKMIGKMNWEALRSAATDLGKAEGLPDMIPPEDAWEEKEQEFLKTTHKLLLELDIIEGHLECPETGRKFNIKNGIPNMLVNEDEVA